MKKLLLLLPGIFALLLPAAAQCPARFTYAASDDTVSFSNKSAIANAHFFWNFGDGTGTNFRHPVHVFPDNGRYLVTLFAKDTVMGCSAYYEEWIDVRRNTPGDCIPSITDSVYTKNGETFLKVIDITTGCSDYSFSFDAAGAYGAYRGATISLGSLSTFPSRMVFIGRYHPNHAGLPAREAFKTNLQHTNGEKHYSDCSANFEFTTLSRDSAGVRILYKAMNGQAASYRWSISGLGSPLSIEAYTDTVSYFYPNNKRYWTGDRVDNVALRIEGKSGCRDSLFQNILIRQSSYTAALNVAQEEFYTYSLYPNPFSTRAVLSYPKSYPSVSFVLYNTLGQVVSSRSGISGGYYMIERNGLAAGLYYYVLTDGNTVLTKGKLQVL